MNSSNVTRFSREPRLMFVEQRCGKNTRNSAVKRHLTSYIKLCFNITLIGFI